MTGNARRAGKRAPRLARAARTLGFAIACVGAAVGFALSASATGTRIDLTARGEHRLSPRAAQLLAGLDAPVELIVAVDEARIDRRALDRIGDVLDAFDASPNARAVRIDAGSAQGAERLGTLAERLIERERPAIEAGMRAGMALAQGSRELGAGLTQLSDAIQAAAEGRDATARGWAQQRSAVARVASDELGALADRVEERLNRAPGVPDPAGAVAELPDALRALDEQLALMRRGVGTLGPNAGPIRTAIDALRERAGAERERALAVERPEAARIAQVLEQGEAALVVSDGPPGAGRPTIAAIELEDLFPPAIADTGRGLSVAGEAGLRAESLFTDAVAALADATPPIVVFVHGEAQRFVGRAGVLNELIGRLRQRGIGVAEWAVAVDPERPALVPLNPGGRRPIVWAVISPNSAAPSMDLPDGSMGPSGSERAQMVADAIAGLLADGEPVLLNLNPSIFPTFGSPDPIAALAVPFGIVVDSGRPVLRAGVGDGRPVVQPDMGVRMTGEHPVAQAASGLPVLLSWPLPLEVGVGASAVATLADDASWAESQWLRLWRTQPAARPLLPDQPTFDQGDARGPFTVAAAAEVDGARLVVVGSNTWFLDARWAERRAVDGRVVRAAPGNPELFEASVLWLAGKDGLIGRGVEASSVARVRALDAGTLAAVRWGLIFGVPGVVLLLGLGVVFLRR